MKRANIPLSVEKRIHGSQQLDDRSVRQRVTGISEAIVRCYQETGREIQVLTADDQQDERGISSGRMTSSTIEAYG